MLYFDEAGGYIQLVIQNSVFVRSVRTDVLLKMSQLRENPSNVTSQGSH